VYKFSIGEEVKVLSKENIALNLDSENQVEGCCFMDQMWQYCGNHFKVSKIVRNIFNYENKKLLRCKSPIYILEGLFCDGDSGLFGQVCDKSCHLLWHQNWLGKI
jgi:hypothetical protein